MKRSLPVFVLLACWPAEASAHLVSTRFGELYGGLLHPLGALEHVVAWLGLGLLGGLQPTTTGRWALVLPAAVSIGALTAAFLPESGSVAHLNLMSFVIVGLLVALARELRPMAFALLAAAIGLSHGYANGTRELDGTSQALHVVGVTLAAYVLITIVTAGAQFIAEQPTWGRIALRAAGSWIVAIGVVSGGFSLLYPS